MGLSPHVQAHMHQAIKPPMFDSERFYAHELLSTTAPMLHAHGGVKLLTIFYLAACNKLSLYADTVAHFDASRSTL